MKDNINISFTAIVDYMKNKDLEIENWRYKHLKEFKERKKFQERIDKAIEYIEERFDYVLKDESFLDHDDLAERRIALHLLNILKGDNKGDENE